MMYTKDELIRAQQKYNKEYLKNKDKFGSCKDTSESIDYAKDQIEYLISLIGPTEDHL